MIRISKHFSLSAEVSKALAAKNPVVALESAVLTHGLPRPENLSLARDMESEVRKQGAVPATVAVMDKKVRIGLAAEQLERLANASNALKVGVRDFAPVITLKITGGTTVSGTLFAAEKAGIKVFATGGIGGVHREPPYDISADLPQLAKTPMIVVCSGAKSILDLPATLEYLETVGVPVLGYQTDEFPAFYSLSSGLPVQTTAISPKEVAWFAKTHWDLGLNSALLVTVPPPENHALTAEETEKVTQQALKDAREQGIHGQASTPFLLRRIDTLTGGASLKANIALLIKNARIAAQIAVEINEPNYLTI